MFRSGFLRTKPAYLFWLPVFFVLHGFRENYGFIKISEALLLAGIYLLVALFLLLLNFWVFRNLAKAGLMAFIILAFHFFFGGIADVLKDYFPGSLVSRYSFITGLFLVVFIFIFIRLKRSKAAAPAAGLYLNSLLPLLLLLEVYLFIEKKIPADESTKTVTYAACADCKKPDIYLLVFDEYAGYKELKEKCGFDNSAFLDSLQKKGFQVVNESRSNYNSTPFSMASVLNMDYVNTDPKLSVKGRLPFLYRIIQNSAVLQFLEAQGYDFYNYSIFDFPGKPSPVKESFLPVQTRLVTSQTFLSRISSALHLNFKAYAQQENNEKIYRETIAAARKQTTVPKFVYAHFMMPHFPFFFNRRGDTIPQDQSDTYKRFKTGRYVEYLQYTNKKILKLADTLLQGSATPPLIILLSDHGLRYLPDRVGNSPYIFYNLNALHYPGTSLPSGISNVNEFRSLFNSLFGQKLPLLKDSFFYLSDESPTITGVQPE